MKQWRSTWIPSQHTILPISVQPYQSIKTSIQDHSCILQTNQHHTPHIPTKTSNQLRIPQLQLLMHQQILTHLILDSTRHSQRTFHLQEQLQQQIHPIPTITSTHLWRPTMIRIKSKEQGGRMKYLLGHTRLVNI